MKKFIDRLIAWMFLLGIIFLCWWCTACVPLIETVVHDIKETTWRAENTNYMPEDYYDYYENLARDILYLYEEYQVYCHNDSSCVFGLYENFDWPYESWGHDWRWVQQEPTFNGFMDWIKNVKLYDVESIDGWNTFMFMSPVFKKEGNGIHDIYIK